MAIGSIIMLSLLLFFVVLFFYFVPLGLWIQSVVSLGLGPISIIDLMDGYESIEREFPKDKYQISILHGRMKPDDKVYEMNRFKNGETQIMVSTTVIEVGVNIPNASVMIIESAERFGLSQLHQLRGRVGRLCSIEGYWKRCIWRGTYIL